MPRRDRSRPVLLALAALATACGGPTFHEIASGFAGDINPEARAAIAEDGTVVAAGPDVLHVFDGTATSTIDLATYGLGVVAALARRPVQVRSEGDVVLVADRTGMTPCVGAARGAYRITTLGGALTTLAETCPEVSPGPNVGSFIAMSPNGTVAVSHIRNGSGAILRGPATGPLATLRSGTGEFFNTMGMDVNDAGRVTAQMEYFDGFAGGLMRGVLAFDTPEQAKADIDTAIEKLGIGQQPPHAINGPGQVAFSINSAMSFPIAGMMYSFDPGVYVATPTQFNTPKSLTLVADLSGPYCRVGAVDIDDDGTVVFEAQLDAGFACGTDHWDGLYTGPDPVADVLVERGDAALGNHQFFDGVRLGEINGAGQIAFVTTYSEPLVPPYAVWRRDP